MPEELVKRRGRPPKNPQPQDAPQSAITATPVAQIGMAPQFAAPTFPGAIPQVGPPPQFGMPTPPPGFQPAGSVLAQIPEAVTETEVQRHMQPPNGAPSFAAMDAGLGAIPSLSGFPPSPSFALTPPSTAPAGNVSPHPSQPLPGISDILTGLGEVRSIVATLQAAFESLKTSFDMIASTVGAEVETSKKHGANMGLLHEAQQGLYRAIQEGFASLRAPQQVPPASPSPAAPSTSQQQVPVQQVPPPAAPAAQPAQQLPPEIAGPLMAVLQQGTVVGQVYDIGALATALVDQVYKQSTPDQIGKALTGLSPDYCSVEGNLWRRLR